MDAKLADVDERKLLICRAVGLQLHAVIYTFWCRLDKGGWV